MTSKKIAAKNKTKKKPKKRTRRKRSPSEASIEKKSELLAAGTSVGRTAREIWPYLNLMNEALIRLQSLEKDSPGELSEFLKALCDFLDKAKSMLLVEPRTCVLTLHALRGCWELLGKFNTKNYDRDDQSIREALALLLVTRRKLVATINRLIEDGILMHAKGMPREEKEKYIERVLTKSTIFKEPPDIGPGIAALDELRKDYKREFEWVCAKLDVQQGEVYSNSQTQLLSRFGSETMTVSEASTHIQEHALLKLKIESNEREHIRYLLRKAANEKVIVQIPGTPIRYEKSSVVLFTYKLASEQGDD